MNTELPQYIWYENNILKLELPDHWDVEFCPMRGAGKKPLTAQEIEKAVSNPIGSPPVRELARGKKKAVVIFDDMTRPTRAYEIAPLIIRELIKAGIKEEKISFVCALGTHGALTQHEFRKKLGSDIVERFRIYNHNCFVNCVEAGTTSYGTRVLVNREVMEADLKIGIGCITAHAEVGFSGGGKIILPGVCHMDTILHYHREVFSLGPETTGLGLFDNNILRFNIEQAARLAGLDFKIDVLVNDRGETTAVFAGDFLGAHARGVQVAKEHYDTDPVPSGKDLIISNAFAKPNELIIAVIIGAIALKKATGHVVVIANSPEGQVVHYLLGRFGEKYGGPKHPVGSIPESLKTIIQTEYPDRSLGDWFANPEVIRVTRNWEQTLALIGNSLGPKPKVAVLPNATMQYFSSKTALGN